MTFTLFMCIHQATFHCFSNLPPEIRRLIWIAALPEIGPLLFLYKKGLWQFRERQPSDSDYDCEHPDQNIVHEFRHDLLDPVQIKTALLAVNLEAHHLTLQWARRNDVQIHSHTSGHRSETILSSKFDPERDILYIAAKDVDDFLGEPLEYMLLDEYLDRLLHQPPPEIRRLSTSVALWQSDWYADDFTDMLRDPYAGIQEIMFIPEDAPETISSLERFPKVRCAWVLKSWTSLDEQGVKDVAQFKQSKVRVLEWAHRQHRLLRFYSCHAV